MVHIQVRNKVTRKFEGLCAHKKVLTCDFPDQPAALRAIVGDGYWDKLKVGEEVLFVDGECTHKGKKAP